MILNLGMHFLSTAELQPSRPICGHSTLACALANQPAMAIIVFGLAIELG